jgi:hypothetical protein
LAFLNFTASQVVFNFCPAAQRLALPAAGGTRLACETEKTQGLGKGQFGGENPAVRVHALLGSPTECKTHWLLKIITAYLPRVFALKCWIIKKQLSIRNICNSILSEYKKE